MKKKNIDNELKIITYSVLLYICTNTYYIGKKLSCLVYLFLLGLSKYCIFLDIIL